jgi:hypothetical protein
MEKLNNNDCLWGSQEKKKSLLQEENNCLFGGRNDFQSHIILMTSRKEVF